MISQKEIKKFQKLIWDYYKTKGRDLPWRNTTDPYKIFISEVMLQQTQVSRVIPKYEAFLSEFPDFVSLAKSDLAKVLRAWSGLGYNRRGRYLWEAAGIIANKYKGIMPQDPNLVDAFPGIGYATASSILVFTYNLPLIFIETNIRRVYIYEFLKNKEEIHDKEIEELVRVTIDKKNPREWYFALMDYGSYLGKLKDNPNKKSAHYTKQPKFQGSTRQMRGKILKFLLNKKSVTKERLIRELPKTNLNIGKIVDSLQTDRLIKVNGKMISLDS